MVELTRSYPPPPPGVEIKLSMKEEEFEKLTPVTCDPKASVDDLVMLSDVNTGAVLNNLRVRYQSDEIFTAIGPILIVVNPYKPLPLCSAEHMTELTQESEPEKLPPHIYKIAHSAFTKMMQTASAQSILISGESGAGKTETTKLCMSSLAEISGSSGKSTEAALESGILLETFGNAKTVHNNNSSRFGKWCAVHFTEDGQVGACKVLSYLLEKSRVVGPGENERNYHVFYQLLAGTPADQRSELKLLDGPADYLYLQGPPTVDGVDDAEEWANTENKLSSLGFSEEQVAELRKLFSAVLLLGNCAFVPGDGDKMRLMDDSVAEAAAALFQVSAPQLMSSLVTRKVASGRGSSYTVPLTDTQCLDTRDALSKAVYVSLFDWIVSRLNVYMSVEAGTVVDEEAELFVGLLDVFGFENFEFNSFEQLCINYTNEKLQQQFIDALIRLQQQDYEREGLQSVQIDFPDNAEQLALLDTRMGVMGLLDEECALPKGSEEAYVEKMHKFFSQSPHYEKPPRGGGKVKRRSVLPSATPASVAGKDLDKVRFSIMHYAGKVTYTAENWIDKNRGFLQPELAFLLSTSSSSLLSSLFTVTPDSRAEKSKTTVLSTFRQSLRQLSATLLQTSARYVRCIKPNALKSAGVFDGQFVARQLRYTGVGAVVEIQRSGYPISLPKADFVARYRCCAFSDPGLIDGALPIDTICANLLMTIQQLLELNREAGADWLASLRVQLGQTKVFLREDVVKHIEKAREAIFEEASHAVQRLGRGLIARRVVKLRLAIGKSSLRVKEAIAAREPVVAAAAFAELQGIWDAQGVSVAVAPELLLASQRDLAQYSAEVTGLCEARELELSKLDGLRSAISAAREQGGSEFVTLKMQLQEAQEASQGLSVELAAAIQEAQSLLDDEAKRRADVEAAAATAADAEAKASADAKIAEYRREEEEVARQEAARKKEREAIAAGTTALDAGTAQLVVEVRNDPRPEKGTGLSIDASNVVIGLVKGSYGAKDGRVRVGDVIVAVDGTSVVGRKAVSAMDEKATAYKLTVLDGSGGGGSGDGGADMEGWLTKVKAIDGRAVRMPEKRWVRLQGSTLTWYKDHKGEHEASSQSLENAVCTLPSRSNGYQMPPAMQAFAKLHKYPFMLHWPNKAVAHELVFAASTSADRTAWATSMKEAISRAQSGAPTCGWLHKEGGRKSGLSIGGWKRRWFTLPKGRLDSMSELKYFDSPTSHTPKGGVRLQGADVFIPKEVRGIKAEHKYNFCLTSLATEKGKTVTICTLLAAKTLEERDTWVRSLSQAVKPELQQAARSADGAAAASGGGLARGGTARQVAGADTSAASLQQGAQVNLEQMKSLPEEDLLQLRIKQLKAVLEHMGVDFGDAVEKKDLVAKIGGAVPNSETSVAQLVARPPGGYMANNRENDGGAHQGAAARPRRERA
eukprot:CAMPEP_0115887378 /NCGR_PEP_ID=MMETSP0287-20121206/31730_1 /TAXON_ID=412157 /ORGANISM="Chrysochromulina rotalis, Strain UIO044" /LENGTH=1428 /DNA_ID=CAMNT_0003343967 /DNA_START=24 /DNA_END=4312 /DNA_ORIENTATION=+